MRINTLLTDFEFAYCMDYYDSIAPSYEELHKDEQLRKLQLIASVVTGFQGRVLDVGCGTGISTDFWHDTFGCECVGIDPSAQLIAHNTRNVSSFIVGHAESLPFDNGEFDVVVSITALQNVDDIVLALQEIKRVGKDTFVLSWLKKSARHNTIYDAIIAEFGVPTTECEDLHDWILMYQNNH